MVGTKRAVLAILGVALAGVLYGCGPECGPGTAEENGECVSASTVDECPDGSELIDGECVADPVECGEGTALVDGVCVPTAEEVECGEKTRLDENGRCVVEAAVCGPGSELAPNSGECVLVDEACGQGTALDAHTGACVPTDEVCDTGTRFDAESGLCLPDSCQVGDVLVDGVCMTPAEELASNSDMSEAENNDPAVGGTADILGIDVDNGEPTVFVGTISEASDLDGDGRVDQDRDVYQFDAHAGEWYEVMIQSTGMPAPAFKVEGPNGYERWSPLGGRDVARDIVIPEDGTYTLTVLPALVLQSGGDINGIGGADWTYVGTARHVAPPAATSVTLGDSAERLTGAYPTLDDNHFELGGLQEGDVVALTAEGSSANVEGVLQVWSDAATLEESVAITSDGRLEFAATGPTVRVLVDWKKITGPDVDFDIEARVVGAEVARTLLPGEMARLDVDARSLEQVMVMHSNSLAEGMDVEIFDPTGLVIWSSRDDNYDALGSDIPHRELAANPGTYEVTFTNIGSVDLQATLVAKAVPIESLGAMSQEETINHTLDSPGRLETVFHEVTLLDDGYLEVRATGQSSNVMDVDAIVFDATGAEITGAQGQPLGQGSDDEGYIAGERELPAGTYFVESLVYDNGTAFDLTLNLHGPPPASPAYASSPNLAIPNGRPASVSDTITVSGCSTVESVLVYVDASHQDGRELSLELTNPDGTTVELVPKSTLPRGPFSTASWFSLTRASFEPLSVFHGVCGNGEWTLTAIDNFDFDSDVGTLDEWGLDLSCQ